MEIVGLKQKVDDDVNKLIAKFVGLPVHPVVKLLRKAIGFKENCEVCRNPPWVEIWFMHLRRNAKEKRCRKISETILYLWRLKGKEERKHAFLKLERWLRHGLINILVSSNPDHRYYPRLFNQEFLEEQGNN